MDLRCVQEAMRSEYFEIDRSRGLFETFTWLVEEVGELGEALLKRDKEGISEELADVIAWTLSVANLLDIDVEEAVKAKYNEALQKSGCH